MSHSINHICFADDDADDHLVFSTVMNELFPFITLNSFYDCNELVKYLDDENGQLPDIIFLDYNMPGNDGNQCLQLIKKTARLLHIPVIIYSTSNYEKLINESYKLGAYKYIVKPSSFDEVKTTVRLAISDYEAGM
ncbi:MAG: response regulator [Bacteroidota bacterium]